MTGLHIYILESNNFTLSENERQELANFIGVLSDNIENDDNNKEFESIITKLSDTEIKQLNSLYNCLSDKINYKKITKNIIANDIALIMKIYQIITDNDLFDEQYDLISAFEKIQ